MNGANRQAQSRPVDAFIAAAHRATALARGKGVVAQGAPSRWHSKKLRVVSEEFFVDSCACVRLSRLDMH
jgi:hypothetical protein